MIPLLESPKSKRICGGALVMGGPTPKMETREDSDHRTTPSSPARFMPRLTYSLLGYPLIAFFWVIMWVLLIRTELRPMDAATRVVPLEHIAKLLFHDEQASELYIHDEGDKSGNPANFAAHSCRK